MSKTTNKTTKTPRMRELPLADYTPAQQEAAAFFEATRGVKLAGPFDILLRSPEVLKRAQYLGAFLRYDCSLSGPNSEFAILIVARIWSNDYEWHIHAPIALRGGVAPDTVTAIGEGRRPQDMTEQQAAIYDFSHELMVARTVSDATYARAQALFGDKGIIDLIGLNGYYSLLAMTMNAVQMQLPAGGQELPPIVS